MFTAPAISAESLRFVRCEKSLDRALAQHAMELAKLPKRERHAVELANPALAEHARDSVAAWAFRVAELGGNVESKVEAVEQPKVRGRCLHYAMIRELFAVAREKGLDVSDGARDRMRGAIGMLLGRRIESRADLSASEWGFCTNAVRMGRLFW